MAVLVGILVTNNLVAFFTNSTGRYLNEPTGGDYEVPEDDGISN